MGNSESINADLEGTGMVPKPDIDKKVISNAKKRDKEVQKMLKAKQHSGLRFQELLVTLQVGHLRSELMK